MRIIMPASIMTYRSVLLFGLLSAAACGQTSPEELTPYKASASVHDYMVWLLEPAADVLWDNAGYVITVEGEQDLQPTTQAGWDKVRDAATVVAEAGNTLMMPGYAADHEAWLEYASGLTVAGVRARDAALAKDAQALFEAGANVYSVCVACHNRYMITEQDTK